MPTRDSEDGARLLQGTLDLLILRTLLPGPQHGQAVARSIQRESEDVFLVDHGSLYLALQRLEEHNLVDATWGVSDNNRRARFYQLTRAGRTQLQRETRDWQTATDILARFLSPGETR